MKRLLPFAAVTLVPALAFALEYEDFTGRYDDAPFSRAETAGISVLTEVGAVEGNPDGTFAPNRTLNRAEFLKIALLAGRLQPGADATCFPDVNKGVWFAPYICTAKDGGIVAGNPDGLYHPERPVNYAEALKILVEIFDYELPVAKAGEPWPWYMPYMVAAQDKGVALPSSVTPDTQLTRGQMARLAAAFVAEDEGELEEYRAFERGQTVSSSSSASSQDSDISASSVSSASSLSSSSRSRSSASFVAAIFPSHSRFLIAGTVTPPIADGMFLYPDEDARIQMVEVELFRRINSLEVLELIDEDGNVLVELEEQSYSNAAKTKWRADDVESSYLFPKDKAVRLGLRARMKDMDDGASSNELLEMRSFGIYAVGVTTNTSRHLVPTDTNYPAHQTSFGHVDAVINNLATSMTVPQGTSRTIGTFTVSGTAATGATISLRTLSFLLQSTNVNVSNLMIGSNTGDQGQCGVEQQDGQKLVTCLVPEHMQSVGVSPVTLSVYADLSVTASATTGTVQLVTPGAGGVNMAGATTWTDGSGTFNWIEDSEAVDSGPAIVVTK